MAIRCKSVTRQYLTEAPLPTHAESYTVISNQFIIDTVLAELKSKGFEVIDEWYSCNKNAEVSTGTYKLAYEGDPEMGLLFAWSNSYDKTMRFKCAIGGYLKESGSRILSSGLSKWGRKHTGTADQETLETIKDQIDNAKFHYDQLINDKNHMKNITVLHRKVSEIMGVLLFDKKLITMEQAGIIRDQIKNPCCNISGRIDSLWAFYNHIIYALQRAHPKLWMDQQRLVHWFLCEEFGIDPSNIVKVIPQVYIDPKQTNMLDEIKDRETENLINKIETILETDLAPIPETFISPVLTDEKITEIFQEAIEKFPSTLEKLSDDDEFKVKTHVDNTPDFSKAVEEVREISKTIEIVEPIRENLPSQGIEEASVVVLPSDLTGEGINESMETSPPWEEPIIEVIPPREKEFDTSDLTNKSGINDADLFKEPDAAALGLDVPEPEFEPEIPSLEEMIGKSDPLFLDEVVAPTEVISPEPQYTPEIITQNPVTLADAFPASNSEASYDEEIITEVKTEVVKETVTNSFDSEEYDGTEFELNDINDMVLSYSLKLSQDGDNIKVQSHNELYFIGEFVHQSGDIYKYSHYKD